MGNRPGRDWRRQRLVNANKDIQIWVYQKPCGTVHFVSRRLHFFEMGPIRVDQSRRRSNMQQCGFDIVRNSVQSPRAAGGLSACTSFSEAGRPFRLGFGD